MLLQLVFPINNMQNEIKVGRNMKYAKGLSPVGWIIVIVLVLLGVVFLFLRTNSMKVNQVNQAEVSIIEARNKLDAFELLAQEKERNNDVVNTSFSITQEALNNAISKVNALDNNSPEYEKLEGEIEDLLFQFRETAQELGLEEVPEEEE